MKERKGVEELLRSEDREEKEGRGLAREKGGRDRGGR